MNRSLSLMAAILLGLIVNAQSWTPSSGNLYFNTGNVGIGTTSPVYKLQINGDGEIGDNHDGTPYGQLQLVRPSNQPDNKFHLSFVRSGISVAGMGYAPNSNVLGIWHANNNSGAPLIAMTYDQKVGIGVLNPVYKFDMDSPNNDAGNGDTRIRLANTTSSGLNSSGSRPTIELLGARGDGNTTFGGKLAMGTRRTDGNALSNQTLGAILFGGQHGTDQTFQASKILYAASIQGMAEGAFTNSTTMPTGIAFFTSSTGDDAGAGNLSYGVERMRITNTGNIGIGTSVPGPYKLAVEGTLGARKIKVTMASPWADYVFEENYPLPTLEEVEQFIKTNKHLPGVPSAEEVDSDGLDLGDTQVILLKKIEELTLYILDQNRKMNDLTNKVEEQNKKIKKLEEASPATNQSQTNH
jgi:hypothetical protein